MISIDGILMKAEKLQLDRMNEEYKWLFLSKIIKISSICVGQGL